MPLPASFAIASHQCASPLAVSALTPAPTPMEFDLAQLSLKRSITVKAIVTDRWKAEAQTQLQKQIDRLDGQLQQLEVQGSRTISDLQRTGTGDATVDAAPIDPQIEGVRVQLGQKKSQLLEQKNHILQQLQHVKMLPLGQEVEQGQIDSLFQVGIGDNLVQKLQVEILLEDGVVREIRGVI